MTVPTHNLYDFVHQVTEKRFWLVYFYPWGSRDLKNIIDYQISQEFLSLTQGLDPAYISAYKIFPKNLPYFFYNIEETQPMLFCHDQEPLNFDFYKNVTEDDAFQSALFPVSLVPTDLNLRYARPMNVLKRVVLLHSEINSAELQKYESTGQYLGAYWWSHAVISRDWFRFAENDQRLQHLDERKRFLVYSRAHTGSRSYRVLFQEMLQNLAVVDHCQFESFYFKNVDSNSSAIYVPDDFNCTSISVVLETVFWDQRIHLTEKILRSIACGHPFILAAGPGSLKLLRNYGFQTFGPWINEDYDTETDHQTRLLMIAKEMSRIKNLPLNEFDQLISACRDIAQKNKQRFFSAEFTDQIVTELKTNALKAWTEIWNEFDLTPYRTWINYVDQTLEQDNSPENKEILKWVRPFVEFIDRGGSFEQYQRHEHGLDNKSNANSHDV